MKTKFNFFVCATTVATHWAVTGNAQIGPPNPGESGAVYTMTNDASDNRILVCSRNSNDALTFQGAVSTQGSGSGGTKCPSIGKE